MSSGKTTNHNWPYPTESDAFDPATDIGALATAIDGWNPIAAGSVTAEKLAAGAVTDAKIGAGRQLLETSTGYGGRANLGSITGVGNIKWTNPSARLVWVNMDLVSEGGASTDIAVGGVLVQKLDTGSGAPGIRIPAGPFLVNAGETLEVKQEVSGGKVGEVSIATREL